jgi:glycyl-tRNA synthetase
MARIQHFLTSVGIHPDGIRFRQHHGNEMAHYAADCWDAEVFTSYGWIECVGCADRSAYDLTRHGDTTGERLIVRERLDEPIVRECIKLELDQKVFGKHFKQHAKPLQQWLMAHDEQGLARLGAALEQHGKLVVSVDSVPGTHEITPDMMRIVKTQETQHVVEYTPHVIEPSFGIGRILYAILEHSFWTRPDDQQRHVCYL